MTNNELGDFEMNNVANEMRNAPVDLFVEDGLRVVLEQIPNVEVVELVEDNERARLARQPLDLSDRADMAAVATATAE